VLKEIPFFQKMVFLLFAKASRNPIFEKIGFLTPQLCRVGKVLFLPTFLIKKVVGYR